MTNDNNIAFHKNKDPAFHISKAKRNERFYKKLDLDKSNFNEWAVVALFYSSLHYIDAVLSLDTNLCDELRDPTNHLKRREAVSNCISLLPIAREYFELLDRSREARYRQTFFRDGSLNNIKSNLFEPIQQHARKHLGINLETNS